MKSITAVITTYKRPEVLDRAIESVLSQKAKPDELFVIDNFGCARSRDIVESFCSVATFPIVYFHEQRKGVSHARNAGIGLAHSEYIAFLDDDDVWLPHHLFNFHKLPQGLDDCAIFAGLRARFGNEEELILPDSNLLFGEYSDQDGFLLRRKKSVSKPFYTASMSESIIKTAIARSVLFDTDLVGREDIYFVWLMGEVGDIVVEKVVHGLADQLEISLFSTANTASSEEKLEMSLKKCVYGVKMLEKWNSSLMRVPTKGMQSELSNAYFDSAYFNSIAGNVNIAFTHLLRSARQGIKIKHFKVFARIVLSFLKVNR